MKRIEALDSLRGLFLLIMTINHLLWISRGDSPLFMLTWQPLGLFGAAEGFIFLSGLLAGAIYSRKSLSNCQLKKKSRYRALVIYKYHLICLLSIFIWIYFCMYQYPDMIFLFSEKATNILSAPVTTLVTSAALINQPDYYDILPIYIVFMLLLPVVIIACRKGLLWLVVSTSIVVWSYSQSLNALLLAPLLTATSSQWGLFNPFAWQFLFVTGAVFGFLLQNNTLKWRHPVFTMLAVVIAMILFAIRYRLFPLSGEVLSSISALNNKAELGFIRVLNLVVWAYLVAMIIQCRPRLLCINGLSYIGRQSLLVFSWHVVLIYFCAPMLYTLRLAPYYSALVVCIASTLWLPAWLHQKRMLSRLQYIK